MEIDDDVSHLTDVEYLLHRAKQAFKIDPVNAKAWLITAKTLYPKNFALQFQAYKIEKEAGNMKEAAKYFSELLENFQEEPDLWQEIEKVTAALRTDTDVADFEKQALCEMFKHISSEVQHQLLLFTADHCKDTIEHCRLLLLLLQKFPSSTSTHGPRLVETLLNAEKHSQNVTQPLNPYRRLLVCDLIPLLEAEKTKLEFSSKFWINLLHKSMEFYLASIQVSKNVSQETSGIDDPWKKLFGVLELTGRHLGWETYLSNFADTWTKESYWQKILTFYQTHKTLIMEDHIKMKQLLYCLTVFFLYCLYEYNSSLVPETCPGKVPISLLLVEGFTDTKLPGPSTAEPKSKRRKGDENLLPNVTIDKPENKNVINNFIISVNCWDLFHSSEHLQREFGKLNNFIKLDAWLSGFLADYAIYKGRYDDALGRLQQINDSTLAMPKNIRQASIHYIKKNYTSCFEYILLTIQQLSTIANRGSLSTQLILGGKERHLHFMCITQLSALQYVVKLLVRCIREKLLKHPTSCSEQAIGNLLVLLQLDWPQEEEVLPFLMDQIRHRGAFSYLLFQTYIVNVDILEELTYLWTEQGGQITLDILPRLGQRRMGTRGADKGVKEEIRAAIKKQIARSNDPLDQLIIDFFIHERGHILQCLM